MTSYPAITFKDFIRKVQKLGFQRIRQQGSHIRFVQPDGRKTTIPDHGNKDVPKGLLSKIIRYDLEMDQWMKGDHVPRQDFCFKCREYVPSCENTDSTYHTHTP